MQTTPADAPGTGDFTEQLADFLFAGGTVKDLYHFDEREMEAVYAHGYNLYNQAQWLEALKVFSFLSHNDHLERRFHVARAGCLQMLREYEAALRAYLAAHVLDATEPSVQLHMAECCIALGRRDEARIVLENTIAAAGTDPTHATTRRRAEALAALLANN